MLLPDKLVCLSILSMLLSIGLGVWYGPPPSPLWARYTTIILLILAPVLFLTGVSLT